MKKFSRLFTLILALALCASFAACNQTQEPTQTQTTAPTAPDPILLERRDAAESYMREMATVLWRAEEDIVWTTKKEINTPELLEEYDGGPMIVRAGRLYRGIPYSYSGAPQVCFELYWNETEEGIPFVSGLDWQSLNGSASHTARVGNDCSGAVQLAWEYVGGNFTPGSTKYMTLANGFLPVGTYENDPNENIMTEDVCANNGGDVMFAAYAQLQKADAVVRRDESGGHTMMVTAVNVVYNGDGSIDGLNSYITVLHQTSTYLKKEAFEYDEKLGEDVYQTYGVDDKYTFMKLLGSGYLPVTCDALVNPAPAQEQWVKDSESVYSFDNILKGQFTSNKMIAYVTITVTDASGQEVTKATCINPRQTYQNTFSFDLERFTTEQEFLMIGKLDLNLKAGSYHCTHVLTDAHGNEHTMRDFDFTV